MPFRTSIFQKCRLSTQPPLWTQHSLQHPKFSQKPHLNPNALFLSNNLFRISIFPQSPIFKPNVHFLPQMSIFYLKIPSFRRSIFPKSPIFNSNAFLPKISSEHQQPDSAPSSGQHFSTEEQEIGTNMFCPKRESNMKSF